MDKYREDLEKWQKLWDKMSVKVSKEPAVISNVHSHLNDISSNEVINEESEELHWKDIYKMSQNIDKVFKQVNESAYELHDNPIKTSSKGKDQELRVTPNFSDGSELRELNGLKMEVESLERMLHKFEVTGEGSDVKNKLDTIRQRIEDLSNMLVPDQEEDFS